MVYPTLHAQVPDSQCLLVPQELAQAPQLFESMLRLVSQPLAVRDSSQLAIPVGQVWQEPEEQYCLCVVESHTAVVPPVQPHVPLVHTRVPLVVRWSPVQ